MSNNVVNFIRPLIGVGKILFHEDKKSDKQENELRLEYVIQEYQRHQLKPSNWTDIAEIDQIFGAIEIGKQLAEEFPNKTFRVIKIRNGSQDETMWISG